MRKTFSRSLLGLRTPVGGFIPVGDTRAVLPRSIPFQPSGNVILNPMSGKVYIPETFTRMPEEGILMFVDEK